MNVDFSSSHITEALRQSDPVMVQIIERHGPCRLEVSVEGGPYDSLASAIIFQQLHGKAAGAIILQRVTDSASLMSKQATLKTIRI
jgi:3-methyladenine DNA glycosylase/8-oxoguanine DNA glycosylase